MTVLVQLSGITKTLKGQEQPREILAGVDLTVMNDVETQRVEGGQVGVGG